MHRTTRKFLDNVSTHELLIKRKEGVFLLPFHLVASEIAEKLDFFFSPFDQGRFCFSSFIRRRVNLKITGFAFGSHDVVFGKGGACGWVKYFEGGVNSNSAS